MCKDIKIPTRQEAQTTLFIYICSMKILSARQCKELDLYTMQHEPIASIDLMERAAMALSEEFIRHWPPQKRIVAFAGNGNKGGDALAMMRILGQKGYSTLTYLYSTEGKLSDECRINLSRLQETGAEVHLIYNEGLDLPTLCPKNDVVVDGLFGSGLNRPVEGRYADVIHFINRSRVPVVSIDIPSGLFCESNSQNHLDNVVCATQTYTIQQPKLSFLFAENHKYVGEWCTIHIGLSEEGTNALPTDYTVCEAEEIGKLLRPRSPFAHKGTMGHALLAVGSKGMAGAAILSAQACLRSGVGKLSLHTPSANLPILQIAVPEAIICTDPDNEVLTTAAPTTTYQSVGIGPGIGTQTDTADTLYNYLNSTTKPVVLDADALNILAQHPEWIKHIPKHSILTPHPKELQGLIGSFPTSYERLKYTQSWAIEHGLIVMVKGKYSQICMPDGHVYFNPTGNAGMATAGSGDVLTGILTGLLAQGYKPEDAVLLGVWWHGSAGDIAAVALEEECMLAGDIIRYMPQALHQLKEQTKKR